jgi:hypothetical protein
MTTSRPLPGPVRKALPWLAGWFGFQAVVALAGWITAWRRNEGDETSLGIRRTVTHNGLELRPTNPQLSRVRVDLAMAGAEIDLTGIPQPPTGIDLTVHVLMAGMSVRVPAGWRVWWQFRGVGGIGSDGTVQRTHDAHDADLRIYATVLFGGIGVEGSAG